MKNYITKYILNLPKQLTKIKFGKVSSDGIDAIVIEAITKRYNKYTCPHCNKKHKHHSKGFIKVNIKYDVASVGLIIISAKKRRFTCIECAKTFTPPLDNIEPRKRISNIITQKITLAIDKTTTAKACAYNNFVSHSFASRIINKTINSTIYDTNFNHLPESFGIDEFKSIKDKMSFIIIDHNTDKIVDIVQSRKSIVLDKYFSKYPLEVREKVKFISMDMYDPYVKLVKKYFKNAVIVFDKFHIMANFTKALNKIRIEVMNEYATNSIEYKRLKKHWKLILTLNNDKWTYDHLKLSYFDRKIPLRDAVEELVETNTILKKSYDFLTVLHFQLNRKEFDAVDYLINSSKEELPKQLKTAVNSYIKYKNYCNNAYNSNITNARVESKIQKIKLIKRTTFGIPNFNSLRNRIFYIQDVEAIKKATNKAVFASKFAAKLA